MPTSWRDVYGVATDLRKDVESSRREFNDRFDTLTGSINTLAQSQEHRFTTLETVQASHTVTLANHGTQLAVLSAADVDRTATARHFARAEERRTEWHRWLVPTMATIAMVVVTALQLLR